MKLTLITALFCSPLFGALTVTVTGVTQTQALLQEQGFSGTCTIQVSSSPSLTPLIPDVTGTEYPGASTDTGRGDTIISTDGTTRTVTIGHMNDDRALANFTPYYYQVSGCGGTVTGSFVTANLSNGTTRSEQTPFNASKWGNLGIGDFDWQTKKTYVDPLTGAKLIPVALGAQTWRTGCGASGCQAGQYRNFFEYATTGTGWTNPGTIISGASSTATVSSSSTPVDLYADLQASNNDPLPYDTHRVLEDIGLVVFGSGTGTQGPDTTVDFCIFYNPNDGCVSNVIQAVLPHGTGAAHFANPSSTDPDGTYPTAFPSRPFFGWTGSSINPLIPNDRHESIGSLAATGSAITMGNSSQYSFFSDHIKAGNRIGVDGSSPSCVNNLCTFAGPATDVADGNLVESLSGSVSGTGSIGAYTTDLYLTALGSFRPGDGVIIAGAGAGGSGYGVNIDSIQQFDPVWSGTITVNANASAGCSIVSMIGFSTGGATNVIKGDLLSIDGHTYTATATSPIDFATGGSVTVVVTPALATNISVSDAVTIPSSPIHAIIHVGALTGVTNAAVSKKVNFRAYGWGIRAWKDNTNGSVTLGVAFKLAGSTGSLADPVGAQGGQNCSSVQVTSGDGEPGFLCYFESSISGFGWLAFVATDGTSRLLSYRTNFSFSDTQGNVFYQGGNDGSGVPTIYQITYTGNYTNELDQHYQCSPSGDCPAWGPDSTDFTFADTMLDTSGVDLVQQIAANQGGSLPAYDVSKFGSGWQYIGNSGHYGFFKNTYAGQSEGYSGGPGAIAIVDLSKYNASASTPAKVVQIINTIDGTGSSNARFAGLHSPQPVASSPGKLFLSLDSLQANSSGTPYGGPFNARVQSVLGPDGVTWSPITCLTWPPNTSVPCHIQTGTATASATTAKTSPLSANPRVGDKIIVGCDAVGATGACSISDSAGNTYSSIVSLGSPAPALTTMFCASVTSTGNNFTVTASVPGASKIALVVEEFDNIGSCTPAATASNYGGGISQLYIGGTVTTQNKSTVISFTRTDGGGSSVGWDPGEGFALYGNTTSSSGEMVMMQNSVFDGVGEYNANSQVCQSGFTVYVNCSSVSGNMQGVTAAFSPSSADANAYDQTCPTFAAIPGTNNVHYSDCVTFRLPQGGVCNVAATPGEIAAHPCPWSPSTASQWPTMQSGDNSADVGLPYGSIDSEHFRILSVAPDTGNTLRVVAARNAPYDYCSSANYSWQGQGIRYGFGAGTASDLQMVHPNGWTLTMMSGTFDSCGSTQLVYDSATGVTQEIGHSFSGHFFIGPNTNGVNYVTGASTLFNIPFTQLQTTPAPLFYSGTAFDGYGRGDLQSYPDNSQWTSGKPGSAWALDTDALIDPFNRTITAVSGSTTIFKVQAGGSASPPNNAIYKMFPMIGWSGRNQLVDVSGPASTSIAALAATKYSMCFALLAGECISTSAVNDVYVNANLGEGPGDLQCASGYDGPVNDCIVFGNNSPGGGIRQFKIYANDPSGAGSRFVSNGWSSQGRQQQYTYTTSYPTGQWAMYGTSHYIDGFNFAEFMVSMPPWIEKGDAANKFKMIPVTVPAGPAYAEVQFGYSRYSGASSAPSLFKCTSRAEACNTSSGSAVFNFESETRTLTSCATGCALSIPAVAPNVMYYRIRRSADGITWTNGEVQAVGLP